jgi:hypothetical protein
MSRCVLQDSASPQDLLQRCSYTEPGRWNPSREAKVTQVAHARSIYSADQVLSTVVYWKYPAYAEVN